MRAPAPRVGREKMIGKQLYRGNGMTPTTRNFILSISGCLLSAVAPLSVQAQVAGLELEQRPLPELPNSISGSETVRSRMVEFIRRDKELNEAHSKQRDESGRTVLISMSTGTIAASPSHPNFVMARINAFNKAMVNAKEQCIKFQMILVSTEAVLDVTVPPQERAKIDAEQLKREGFAQEGAVRAAQALNADINSKAELPQIIKTAALYGEKILGDKMAAELRKKGLDPSKPVDQQVAKAIAETTSFRNAVSAVAAGRCTGIKAMASFEQNPASGQGEVGVVTVWTEKVHAIADAIVTNNWDLIPKGAPGKPIADQIPDDLRTLLTTFGTQLVRNESGDYVVLAFAQAQPTTRNQQSINTAYQRAELSAEGLIRSFMGELAESSGNALGAEASTIFSDQSTRYQDNSSFQRSVTVVGKALPIIGRTVAKEWETLHPANNGPVVGVVMQWKVASAQIAAHLSKLNRESGARAGAVAANPSGSSAAAQSPARSAEPGKADSYSGQGRPARDF